VIVSLVGMPGSGKSTVGRQLARQLGWRFVDSDAEIERRIGTSIRAWFEQHGEASFRDMEQATLADLAGANGSSAPGRPAQAVPVEQAPSEAMVLATGGGSVLREANRTALKGAGKVVYLRSSPDELFRRLRHDRQRPLLQVADPMKRLRDLYAERDPLYRLAADFIIETGRPSVPTLVNMILMQLELAGVVDPNHVRATVGAGVPGGEA
jgi:shikimate kinase